MRVSRRHFIRGGAAAFTFSFTAPAFLSTLARAQGASARSLVVLYLSGGNDALSMVVPYTDPAYFTRRPTIAVRAGDVLQIGGDRSGVALGLHPRLTGLKTIFEQGRLAIVQRTGYPNQSRSHFLGNDIWATGDPGEPQGPGWLGRYLDSLPAPIDPLAGWNTTRETPHLLQARNVGVPAIPSVSGYAFASPNTGQEAANAREAAARISSHMPVDRPHVAFVNASAQAALATLDRVAAVGRYRETTPYPGSGLGQALKAVAGALATGVGTSVFYVQTGGFDTHAQQNPNAANGAYFTLMATVNDAVTAFYVDLQNQGLLSSTMLVQYSEFGRRISENGSAGTDHGAAGVMLLMGGSVRGGLHGSAPRLESTPDNPTLENNAADVRMEADFRSVYAAIVDRWLGADSVHILGGNFRAPQLALLA
jgi:uncharacterized protein (DUF1501 family)